MAVVARSSSWQFQQDSFVQHRCLCKNLRQARVHIYVDCTFQSLAHAQGLHQRSTIALALQVKLQLHVFGFALYPSNICVTLSPYMSMFWQDCE